MIKYACVTGADRGLGLEMVKELLKKGYHVFAGKYQQTWTLLEDLKSSYADQLTIIDLDVSSDESVKKAANKILEKTHSLEVVINNSAITGNNMSVLGDELNYDEMLKVINVNAIGAIRVTNELFSLLKNGEKKWVMNISSEAGSIGDCHRKGWFAYCSSKAAMNMLSSITHNNLKEIGGQVIIIHPGWMKSWLSGKYHDEGPLTADIPAKKIIAMLDTLNHAPEEHPLYIDYEGNSLKF
ncbi:MAG: short-chain dehydrogenase [Tenericutes bacterium HGW-Tenericutes-1]|jgi:NAD(P)-dependent dehydrogenase (short-subunit alcohol dehydrogenase family)|nr:MAG: short-chain dehydrogenase [Tenericutes bacterium HGW-Tenericutes-1]